jgi:hypothetical protein
MSKRAKPCDVVADSAEAGEKRQKSEQKEAGAKASGAPDAASMPIAASASDPRPAHGAADRVDPAAGIKSSSGVPVRAAVVAAAVFDPRAAHGVGARVDPAAGIKSSSGVPVRAAVVAADVFAEIGGSHATAGDQLCPLVYADRVRTDAGRGKAATPAGWPIPTRGQMRSTLDRDIGLGTPAAILPVGM